MVRPSGLPIIDDAEGLVTVNVAEVEKRGRLNILPRWRKRVVWMNSLGEKATDALMIFSQPGLLSICCWQPNGPRIEQRIVELSNSADPDALEVLRLIQDRYQRIVIPARDRPTLGDSALAHLGLPIHRGQKSLVYVSVFSNRIDVMSPSFRDAKLIEGHPLLDDLP